MKKALKTIGKIAAILAGIALIASSFALSVGAQSPTAHEHASVCASFMRDLTIGTTGSDVTSLQKWLIEKGQSIPAGATGYFGTQTRAALAAYQGKNGIVPALGYFGPKTRGHYDSVCKATDHDHDEDEEDEDEDEEDTDEDDEDTDDDSDDREVSVSASVEEMDGADNDYATFEIEFDLEAFGEDAYIAQNPAISVEYEIQDNDGDAVGSTSVSAILQSSADASGSYYVIDEGDEESLTLVVTFDPLAAGEGSYYRLQLLEVGFADEAAAPDRTWTARPAKDVRTNYVYIAD